MGPTLTGYNSTSGNHTRLTFSPTSRRSIWSMLATVSFKSNTLGATACLRAKASSCRVKVG